ncbi:MAG TPA: bifunctional UDP-N-acetylglucosamine diphosphorylase/glucosamine-1-phosphate N-acetyltransferase GlmU [Nitrosomonas sp.]|nr:bifunctional UDP-N-acetylglucosamine diphosphorylase/glucosamine-1-phosphate N-acetyltransferase GlmU [Nitrosomonas sp.]HMW20936.1 bifunctional UDP-N-acetylglucosamine diphosphorylase/glucosamine-1-phosphate N-acetyltransferase GlmU [Nitrosomonas sp.]HMW68811.1 bifunctional UDP-N-acetylglucosamine diphosphorylase/glucosamine-1-phosphate N-acetyltransferase GlmU [Nitrosomonas sp.]HMY89981.1 bifunctional UDP-N-acetylglucosamine diphosphorylase/glucosamine-1-phosphate N-acetyltransferase GlmU [N
MSDLDIVILAAGVGKRMRSSLPKVLHKLAGKPLLKHAIDTAQTLSPRKIYIVYGHGGEQVLTEINDDQLTWVKQEPQLGTGHALLQVLPFLAKSGKTLVLLGDVPLIQENSLTQLVASASANNFALLTVTLANPFGYGRIIREDGTNQVSAIVEEKDANEIQRSINEINTGIMVLPNAYLHDYLPKLSNSNAQGEYYLTDIIKLAASSGIKIETAQPHYEWEVSGINSKVQLAQLERAAQNFQAQQLLDAGVTLMDPSRIDIRGNLICGNNVEIDVNCIFEGTVTLGDNIKINANCIIRDTIISSGTTVLPFSLIDNAEIGKNCHIGPYARIRPGTRLDDNVHIGNFVEIKNSYIAMDSKANHLSYIGDATIGKKVNIGAGTITCNYDGAYKHQTIIEDNVFVGSDTQLIAPVKVAKGSTIGAGSTITRDTPEEQLTLSRAKQISVAGWKRPSKTKV